MTAPEQNQTWFKRGRTHHRLSRLHVHIAYKHNTRKVKGLGTALTLSIKNHADLLYIPKSPITVSSGPIKLLLHIINESLAASIFKYTGSLNLFFK